MGIIIIIIIKTVSYQSLCPLPHFETEVWAIRKFPENFILGKNANTKEKLETILMQKFGE